LTKYIAESRAKIALSLSLSLSLSLIITIAILTLLCTYPSFSSSLSDSFAIDSGQPAFALSWRQNQNRYQDYLALDGERALASFPRAHKRENGPQKHRCMTWDGMAVHRDSKDIYYVSVKSDNTTKIQRVETRPPDLQCMHAWARGNLTEGGPWKEYIHIPINDVLQPRASIPSFISIALTKLLSKTLFMTSPLPDHWDTHNRKQVSLDLWHAIKLISKSFVHETYSTSH
jgi:hypothetical protein